MVFEVACRWCCCRRRAADAQFRQTATHRPWLRTRRTSCIARLPFPRSVQTAGPKNSYFSQRARAPAGAARRGGGDRDRRTLRRSAASAAKSKSPARRTGTWDAIFQLCSEGYFPTLGLRLLQGRTLSEVEVNDARKVAVVNQTFVTQILRQGRPDRQRINIRCSRRPRTAQSTNLPSKSSASFPMSRIRASKNPTTRDLPALHRHRRVQSWHSVAPRANPPRCSTSVRREIWALDRNVALTITDTLRDFLRQFVYAAPHFSLARPQACSPAWDWCS